MAEITSEILKQRIVSDHLQTSIAEAKQEAEQAVVKAVDPAPKADPKMLREYLFEFKFTTPGGKVFTGTFTNKILNVREKELVGIMRARLSGGIAYEVLDTFTKELNMMVSHLSISLKEKPDWAKDLLDLDEEVIHALYAHVAEHEATFRGY